MINEIDADRKGTIEFHEFLNMMQKQRDYIESEDEILEAFSFVNSKFYYQSWQKYSFENIVTMTKLSKEQNCYNE